MATTKALCPRCRQRIDLDLRIEIGDQVSCWRCGADWKVASRAPLVLDWIDDEFEAFGSGRLGLQEAGSDRVPIRRLWPVE
jgi:lysine biosynthesis protein LysW